VGREIPLPGSLARRLDGERQVRAIQSDFGDLRKLLLSL
jgi:hypothetical protein